MRTHCGPAFYQLGQSMGYLCSSAIMYGNTRKFIRMISAEHSSNIVAKAKLSKKVS